METALNRLPVARTSTRNRSRITNGSELLRGVDGRSAEGRRYRDLTDEIGPLIDNTILYSGPFLGCRSV